MAVFKCKMCGGSLDISDGVSVSTCEYCGTKQTVPKSRDEVVANLFNRANNLRLKCEFDKAEQVYEKILDIDNTDSEAHWGIVLCKYGIEYVEDPKTYSRIPTCHRTLYEAVLADVNYLAAIENADAEQKELYIAEAKVIDELQKNILSIVNSEEPFDVFICYKETDEDGKRTIDSAITNDIYYQLTEEGFKVFYAPITLEDKLGHEYEPYIFAALNSAKVMLVIGTKPEYFDSVWVRNEWSRFMKLTKSDRSKMIIPCYKNMDAYELPDEFTHLQAQDMGKIGFITDVIRGLKKVFDRDVQPQRLMKRNKDKKPSKLIKFINEYKRKKKQKAKYGLEFSNAGISTTLYFVCLLLNIFFFLKILVSLPPSEYWSSYLFVQALTLFIPTKIVLKRPLKKVTAMVIHSIGTLLCLWVSSGCGSLYSFISEGFFLPSILITLTNILLLILIFCTRKIVIEGTPKQKSKKCFLIALIISIVFSVALSFGGMKFFDYQFAKLFYSLGEYSYAEEYFNYLGDYKESVTLKQSSLYNQVLQYIDMGDYETAIYILEEEIPDYKDAELAIKTVNYNKAKSLYNEHKYSEAKRLLMNLGDFEDSKALLSKIRTEMNRIASEKINPTEYIECTVEELYKNPKKYHGKKVSVTSLKVLCNFEDKAWSMMAHYNALLCDSDDTNDGSSSTGNTWYGYYSDYLLPYNVPYVGVQAYGSRAPYISEHKEIITVYGTFTYNSGKKEGDRISGEPHVYNIVADCCIE